MTDRDKLIEAAGFAVVPVEPTEAMLDAGVQEMPNPACLVSAYRAMIAAATNPAADRTKA